MIESNRMMIQMSVLSALIAVSFTLPVRSMAAKQAPVKIATSDKSLTPEQLSTHRLLMRYSQLWNMYRFRNQTAMSPTESDRVDALIAPMKVPQLHTEMSIADIRAKIRSNSVELSKLLTTEIAKGAAPESARANLVYLKALVRGLSNTRQYTMSDAEFEKEFSSAIAENAELPESMTKIQSVGSVPSRELVPLVPTTIPSSGVSN